MGFFQLRYIWDYGEPSAVHTLPGDSAIISVALCPARSEAFARSKPQFLLVMATRLSVSLIGLNFEILGSSATFPGRPSLQVVTNLSEGYSTSTDGAVFHSIVATPAGRIFLLSGAPHVYELRYSAQEGWFRSKCRLIRHTVGLGEELSNRQKWGIVSLRLFL